MLNKPLEMHDNCPVCGQNFMPEPGFYYGAMFVSYLLSSFFFLFIAGVTIIYFGWTVEGAFGLIIFLGIILYIWLLRISRSIWIHFMVKYERDAKDNYRERNF
jgi:TM2 domain-containing membrane protein YozV